MDGSNESPFAKMARATSAAVAEASVTGRIAGYLPRPLSTLVAGENGRRALATSYAKAIAASGALKPAATPAAAPEQTSVRRCALVILPSPLSPAIATERRATTAPSSTAGPSGPREQPVPSVKTEATVRTDAMPRSTGSPAIAASTLRPKLESNVVAGGVPSRRNATAHPPSSGSAHRKRSSGSWSVRSVLQSKTARLNSATSTAVLPPPTAARAQMAALLAPPLSAHGANSSSKSPLSPSPLSSTPTAPLSSTSIAMRTRALRDKGGRSPLRREAAKDAGRAAAPIRPGGCASDLSACVEASPRQSSARIRVCIADSLHPTARARPRITALA
mmetsp:Transcript_6209/g.15150  ORF Transcript_6209/g.15150 Transcript_6209/m.15150 type:complete len:334 (-) Transcript_6209:28-1029(-)